MNNPGLVRTGFPHHFALLEIIQMYIYIYYIYIEFIIQFSLFLFLHIYIYTYIVGLIGIVIHTDILMIDGAIFRDI